MQTINCSICGGMVVDGKQKYRHAAKCGGYRQEGVDYVRCRECGYRSPMLSQHIRLHGMDDVVYLAKHPGAELVLRSIVERQSAAKVAKGGYKSISEKRGAEQCVVCGGWYQPETSKKHFEECVAAHPDKYIEGKDYVRCPECGLAMRRLGGHLRDVHGWDVDRVAVEVGKGLKLMAEAVADKVSAGTDYDSVKEKREATMMERYGVKNPFEIPDVQAKMKETSRRRYGSNHPMQNEDVFMRQNAAAHNGPSAQEVFFDEHTCDSVVFTGYGGRFIRTKTGVHKYGRLVKDLNPDFMVLPDNVLDSARDASNERRRLSSQKHRTKYVVELLGDWYHSEKVLGVKPEEHEMEVVEAYRSAGIECLVLWEKDVMGRWETIRSMVDVWVERAVRDINENPVWRKSTVSKVDRRVGELVCPYGSGRRFKSSAKLARWVESSLNFWRPEMIEGKDYVRCMECENVRVGKVAEHLRRSHGGMTKVEYLERHPGALMVAVRVSENRLRRIGCGE